MNGAPNKDQKNRMKVQAKINLELTKLANNQRKTNSKPTLLR